MTANKAESDSAHRIGAVRHFNRFYTQHIGVLREGLLRSPHSLTEVRVLYEISRREEPSAAELSKDLGIDAGYLSRILRGFVRKGLVEKRPSKSDGRRTLLRLTKKGQKEFAMLNARQDNEVGAMLNGLPQEDQNRLIESMRTIQRMLGAEPEQRVPYILRPHQPGDMGWVVHRHGVLYSREYGWDEHFESLVAGIVADFIKNYNPKRERCWMAEREGEIVGSVFLVEKSKTVGQLRLLLVEPKARGLGIGKRLVDECIRFARQVGYRKIMLWTNDVLDAARHIYEQAGFRLVKEEAHHSFGHDLVGQNWELTL
ncbi:MAG TPA: helix-turn-helix domain-containing GNAT family N-acetyltransferase [Pyrinomonadaceae bacterium]|nr:helix-turn-helix domain-containing GNAT family N-acetyltransferase [Pyrinomonadaceae bacterium]